MLSKSDHVVVNKGSSSLYKPSNCKCQILNWSLMNWTTKLRKPSHVYKQREKKKMGICHQLINSKT